MELEGHELEEIKCEIDIDEFQLKVEDIKHEPEDDQHEDVDFTLLDPDLDSSDSPVSNLLASNVLLTSKEGVSNIVPNIAPVSTKVWKTTTPIVPKPAKINKCGFCMFSSEDFNEYLVHIHVNHNQTRWDSNKISTNIVPKPSKMNKCGLCTFIYEDLKTYMLHIQRVHNVHGYLANHHQCPYCSIYYEHFKEYEIHKFVCHRRNYPKNDIKLRSQHQISDKIGTEAASKSTKISKCGLCTYTYEDIREYMLHMHSVHNSKIVPLGSVPESTSVNNGEDVSSDKEVKLEIEKSDACEAKDHEKSSSNSELQMEPSIDCGIKSTKRPRYGYLANHHQCPHCLIYYEHFKEYEIHKFVCHRRNYQKKDIKLRSQSHQNTNMKPKGKVHSSIKNKEKHAKIDLECDICGLSGFPDSIRLKIHLKRSKVHKEKVLSDTKKHMLHSNPLIQEYNRKIIYWNQ